MKHIFIERKKEMLRIAIKEENKLVECFIEEENLDPVPGQIYLGVVKNIVPAIKCAFIDIGWSKNCYMYLDKKFNNTSIKKGDEIVVEIIKEDLGGKGPKVTNAFSIPGRYSVIETLDHKLKFSQNIHNEELKNFLRSKIEKPDNIGLMLRTNAENADIQDINNEVKELYEIFNNITREARCSVRPKLLYSDEGVLDRVLRDNLDNTIENIIVDNESDYKYIKSYMEKIKSLSIIVQLYEGNRTLFDNFGMEKEILSLRNNKVFLNCGGFIIMEKTEAMYVIDVNSGKNIKGSSIEKTLLCTNLEAAEEIARQIRLRNISGIIVIDFIDMADNESKEKVLLKLKEGFKRDKNKTVIHPFTELNLVQLARRRRGRVIYEYIEEDCSSCSGSGKKLKLSYMSMLIRNELIRISSEQNIKDIYIEINKIYKNEISKDIAQFIKSIDAEEKKVYINYVSNVEYFKVDPLILANHIANKQIYKIYG